MRRIVEQQPELTPAPIAHEHACEMVEISGVIDENPEILDLIHRDLVRGVDPKTGRDGLTAEQTLRALVVKRMKGCSYKELAFLLSDSQTYRGFCRLSAFSTKPLTPSRLQANICRIRPETFEAINRVLVLAAKRDGIEDGRKARVDCTATQTNIHSPTDSGLLWDSVRVLARLMKKIARALDGDLNVFFRDHTRAAKRRWQAIHNAKRMAQRVPLYENLIRLARDTVSYGENVVRALVDRDVLDELKLETELRHYIGLARRVIDQTERRVLCGEQVPSDEKIVSIFEEHTDIIKTKKGRTGIDYGHKLCLTTGASSMVLDLVIEDGNPADASLAVRMIQRQQAIYGRVPRQTAFDGGFASKSNLWDLKQMGVKDAVFHKKRGLEISDMAKSSWVYRCLRRFRAGMEGVISFLKRCFGLDRCNWSGSDGFKRYVWSSTIAANLLIMARHRLARA